MYTQLCKYRNSKYCNSGDVSVGKIFSEFHYLQEITSDKSSKVHSQSYHVMKIFGSCHLIINRNPLMIIGTFVTLLVLIYFWVGRHLTLTLIFVIHNS